MTVTVGIWAFPLIVTVAVFAWAFLMPMPARHGDYNFGGAISALFRLVVVIIITLLAWLIYFMVT